MDYNEARTEVLKLLVKELKGGSKQALSQHEISRRTGVPEDEVITIVLRTVTELNEEKSRLDVSGKEISFGVKVDAGMIRKMEELLGSLDQGDNIPDWS